MTSTRLTLRPLWLLAPLLFIGAVLLLDPDRPPRASAVTAGPPRVDRADRDRDRLVVVIVDSLRRQTLEAPGTMPNLLALAHAPGSVVLDTHTCASNFSLPCLQTIFEGRESPMASGLTEFTGGGRAGRNLLETAAESGVGVALASNELLDDLYGRHARVRARGALRRLDPLQQDVEILRRAVEILRDRAIGLLVVHTPGTDYITHYDLPGSVTYVSHFRRVDAGLHDLVASLDLSRDSLVVLGDHGHDENGHHVRESVALFAGRRFEERFAGLTVPGRRVEARDLLYFLSYPQMLPLPADFEGTFFASRGKTVEADVTARFEEMQRQALEAAGWSSDAIATRMRPDWRPDSAPRRRALWRALPLLLCLLAWVVACYDDPLRRAPRATVTGGLVAGGIWLAELLGAPPEWLLAAPAAWLFALARSGERARVALVLAALLAGAAATSAVEPAWTAFFHSRGELNPAVFVFFALVLAVGLAVGAARTGRARDWPFGTQLACVIALPPGVYYYQSDQNPLRGYLIPAALLMAGTWWTRRSRAASSGHGARERATVAALLVAGLLLLPQEAGGWQWHAWMVGPLEAVPQGVSWALLGALGGWMVLLVPGSRSRFAAAALVTGLACFSYFVGGLRVQSQVAAMVTVLFCVAWLGLGQDGVEPASPLRAGEREGLMVLAVALVVVLSTVDGFVVNNVDFTFALQAFRGAHGDGTLFLAAAPGVALKYGWPLLALVACSRWTLGAPRTGTWLGWTFLFLVLKLLALLLQLLVGALDPGQKFFELAMTDVVFVACIGVTLGMWTAAVWACDAVAARARPTVTVTR
jgi:hypothetical protein